MFALLIRRKKRDICVLILLLAISFLLSCVSFSPINNQDNFLPSPSALLLYPQKRRIVYQINPDTVYIRGAIERRLGRPLKDFHPYEAFASPLLAGYSFIAWYESPLDFRKFSEDKSDSSDDHLAAIRDARTTYILDYPVIKNEFNQMIREAAVKITTVDMASTLAELFVKCASTTLLPYSTIIIDSIPSYNDYFTEVIKQKTQVINDWKSFNIKFSTMEKLPHYIIEEQLDKALNKEIEREYHIQKWLSRIYKPGIRAERKNNFYIISLYTYTPDKEKIVRWKIRVHLDGTIESSAKDCSFIWRLF